MKTPTAKSTLLVMPGATITIEQARAAARAVKKMRADSPRKPIVKGSREWERCLGHFGPPIRKITKKSKFSS